MGEMFPPVTRRERLRNLLYKHHSVRKAWWKTKKLLNQNFNDREKIQELIDSGVQTIALPNPVYHIDRTIYFNSNTKLVGTYQSSNQKVSEK